MSRNESKFPRDQPDQVVPYATGKNNEILSYKENTEVLGPQTNERISTLRNEVDNSLARGRLHEACEFAGHVETIASLHLDIRKTEAV